MPHSYESSSNRPSNRRGPPLRLWRSPQMSLMHERRDEYDYSKHSLRDEYNSNGHTFGDDGRRNNGRRLAPHSEPSTYGRHPDAHARYHRDGKGHHYEKKYHTQEYRQREHHSSGFPSRDDYHTKRNYPLDEREFSKSGSHHHERMAFHDRIANPISPPPTHSYNRPHTHHIETRRGTFSANSGHRETQHADRSRSAKPQSFPMNMQPFHLDEAERRKNSGTDSFSDISSSSCSPSSNEEEPPTISNTIASSTQAPSVLLSNSSVKSSPSERVIPPKNLSQLSRRDLERLIPHMNDIDAKYEKISQIGEGTYGKVFKGVVKNPTNTQQFVAMKKVRMECEKEGFPITATREIKILSSISHKNIIQLIEIVTSKGTAATGSI